MQPLLDWLGLGKRHRKISQFVNDGLASVARQQLAGELDGKSLEQQAAFLEQHIEAVTQEAKKRFGHPPTGDDGPAPEPIPDDDVPVGYSRASRAKDRGNHPEVYWFCPVRAPQELLKEVSMMTRGPCPVGAIGCAIGCHLGEVEYSGLPVAGPTRDCCWATHPFGRASQIKTEISRAVKAGAAAEQGRGCDAAAEQAATPVGSM